MGREVLFQIWRVSFERISSTSDGLGHIARTVMVLAEVLFQIWRVSFERISSTSDGLGHIARTIMVLAPTADRK